MLISPAHAQATYIYGECAPTGAPTTQVESDSVDSFVPSDPAAPGLKIAKMTAIGLTPVANRVHGNGGIAVDKINKVIYATDGNLLANPTRLSFTKIPTPAACSAGNGGAQSTFVPGGTYPLSFEGIDYIPTGLAIEYRRDDDNNRDEAYRMWVAATEPSLGLDTLISFWWMTPSPPGIEVSGNWYAGSLSVNQNPQWLLAESSPAKDIAFGLVNFFEGEEPQPPHPCLFSLLANTSPPPNQVRAVDVYDLFDVFSVDGPAAPARLPFLYTNFTFFLGEGADHFGIALDTSMPQDWGPGNPTNYGPSRLLSGRVLVYGVLDDGTLRIRDINRSPNPGGGGSVPWNEWIPGAFCPADFQSYVGGMDYSAELVSLGLPGGLSCSPLAPAPSDVRADIFYPRTVSGSTPNPRPLPGQPLMEPICPTYNLAVDPCAQSSFPTSFEIEACGTTISPLASNGVFTPILLMKKNGVSPVTIQGKQLIVDPVGDANVFLLFDGVPYPGSLMSQGGQFTNLPAQWAPPQITPGWYGVPPQTFSSPGVPKWHYYYGQWAFVCGNVTTFQPHSQSFFVSDPFRIGLSNAH